MALAVSAKSRESFAQARETLDRVVASVDNIAITRSDLEEAYGFELFAEGKAPKGTPDAAALELVRDRRVDQILLLREADIEGISAIDISRVSADTLPDIRKKFGNEEAFRSALKLLDMTEQGAVARLGERQRILTLIDRRMRPSVRIEPPDIEAYYKTTLVPEMGRTGAGPAPPMADVEDSIREILTQKKIDELLAAWLDSVKANHRVIVHPV